MQLAGTVAKGVKQVFGETFFTYVEEAAGVAAEPKAFALESEISFSGELTGRLRLVLSRRLAEQMAANLVGQEPEGLSEELVADAVNEAANILCCNLLRLAGVQASAVSIPVARGFQEEPSAGQAFEFDAEGEPLRVVIRLEDDG